MVEGGHVGFTNLTEGSRRGDLEPAAIEELADLADRLELGHVRLQKEAIDRPTAQGDVVTKQGGIIGHGVALLVLEHSEATSKKGGPQIEVPLIVAGLSRRYEVARYA